jgi:protein arginine kinase
VTLPSSIVADVAARFLEPAPCDGVVVSSRTRYARNIAGHGFAPHATGLVLARARAEIVEAFTEIGSLNKYHLLEMTEVSGRERGFLKEARFISKEMERGGAHRAVYISPELKSSIMVNEEDHLRIQCLEPGLQIGRAQERLNELEAEIGRVLTYAYHEQFGYLTACPTNVGTGLRASVMMHLPALTLKRDIDAILAPLPSQGLTVRGFNGENSDNTGDLYQISNEVTLGRTVEEIEELLAEVVGVIMDKEMAARSLLSSKGGVAIQDTVWRSYGVLTHARRIDSGEAMKLLSRVRLGIDEGCFPHLSHAALNLLISEIQPGHLMLRHGAPDETDERDTTRARLIREALTRSP